MLEYVGHGHINKNGGCLSHGTLSLSCVKEQSLQSQEATLGGEKVSVIL